jgi:Ca2+/Na+ antiporter
MMTIIGSIILGLALLVGDGFCVRTAVLIKQNRIKRVRLALLCFGGAIFYFFIVYFAFRQSLTIAQ